MKTILAPVDLSPASEEVARQAGRYGQLTGAKVVLLHVISPPVLVASYGVPSLVHNSVEERFRVAEHEIERLQRLAQNAGARQVVTRVIKGSVTDMILDEAAGLPADQIVIGSHGHGAMYDLLLGSTSAGVIKRATCPVLLLPAHMATLS